MGKNMLQSNQVIAIAKYVRMGPNKLRRILRQIKGNFSWFLWFQVCHISRSYSDVILKSMGLFS